MRRSTDTPYAPQGDPEFMPVERRRWKRWTKKAVERKPVSRHLIKKQRKR